MSKVQANKRYACDVGDCRCDYASIGGLRVHQKKKHAEEFSGVKKKRPPSPPVPPVPSDGAPVALIPTTVMTVTAYKKKRVAERRGEDEAEAPLTLETLATRMKAMEDSIDTLQGTVSTFNDNLRTSLDLAGQAASDAVQPILQELTSEVFAHVTDIRQQFSELAKKTTKWCVVCFERENEYAFMPCRHKCVCRECAQNIATKYRRCPICREPIKKAVAIFDMSAWEQE